MHEYAYICVYISEVLKLSSLELHPPKKVHELHAPPPSEKCK
jgi:hypothetical protein